MIIPILMEVLFIRTKFCPPTRIRRDVPGLSSFLFSLDYDTTSSPLTDTNGMTKYVLKIVFLWHFKVEIMLNDRQTRTRR